MLVIFFLGGILITAFCVIGWIFYSVKTGKASFTDEGVTPPLIADRVGQKVEEANGKKGFGSIFHPPSVKKNDIADSQEKEPVASSFTMPSSSVTEPSVSPPSAMKDPLIDDKLALKDAEIRQLQQEVADEKERARQALDAMDPLRDENARLRGDINRFQSGEGKSSVNEEELRRLREENAELKAQLEVASLGNKGFQEQIEAIRREFGDQLSRANEAIARLEKENEGLRSSSQDSSQQVKTIEELREEREKNEKLVGLLRYELEGLQRDNQALKAAQDLEAQKLVPQSSTDEGTLERVKADLDGLRKNNALLENRVHELEQNNNSLQEKNAFLQYELTKSRAQASGFERICEGGKKRLEDMARDLHSVEQERESFRRKMDELEKNLEVSKRNDPGPGAPENGS